MRTRIALLVLLAVLPPAWADPNDLGGGVFIAHYVPEVTYSHDPPYPCETYAPYAITGCAQQCTRVDTDSMRAVVWFVIAAWTEDKEFWGVELGVGTYSEDVFRYMGWDVCFPPGGGLVIPAGHFPGPNQGTVFVATGEPPWRGNYVPVLYVAGNAYAQSTVIPLSVNPPTGFAGTWTDNPEPRAFPAMALGALGINTDGLPVCPGDPPAVCCLSGELCWLMSAHENCEMLGGVWHPDWITCEPNPCVPTPVTMSTWGGLKGIFR